MTHEHVIYTRTWLSGRLRLGLREVARSVAFGLVLFIGLAFLLGPAVIHLLDETASDSSLALSNGSANGAFWALLLVGILPCVFCWWAALEVADDRHWRMPRVPTVWDEHGRRWIASTVAFAKHLESRGEHIRASLVKHDDARAVAHYMIDHLDDRTVQLYLSLLSAIEAETSVAVRSRVRGELQGHTD